MISLVIPCYNESEVLPLTYQRLVEAAREWNDSVEMIFVDDGSSDGTWPLIQSLVHRDVRVCGLRLSRNFGHQAAMGAGLERARGDAVIVLDADLQDPPSLIGEMLTRWREGYDVVYAQRNRRHGETRFKRFTASLFYRLMERFTGQSIPRDAGDFSLLDARVARTLVSFREHSLFWRGLRSWSGYRQTAVRFDRPERAAGTTKYTFRKMFRLASHGLLCFSELPMRMPLYAGAAALLLTGAACAWSVLGSMIGGTWAERTMAAGSLGLFFLGAVQLLCLGVMGEYLNRIYDEVRNRPRWIVDQEIGGEGAAESLRSPHAA
jgi:dolichol-phosphate mannosyltransferase